MPDNPNRDLEPEQVEALFNQHLPHLVTGLGRDRSWIWWAGPKPEEQDRTKLRDLGFSFTPRPHALGDGRSAFWFHPCGGAVIRRRRNGGGEKLKSNRSNGPRVSTGQQSENSELQANLSRLANLL